MLGHMAVAVAFTAAAAFTAAVADFTAADSMVADFTAADSTVVDFTMAGSTMVDFTITGFSSVDRSGIPGRTIIQTMGITITANPTPRRLGTIVPILPGITLM
jgi:hypothetical protein